MRNLFVILMMFTLSGVTEVAGQGYQCAPFKIIRDVMLKQWGEIPTHLGQAGDKNSGNFTVIFTNSETKSYTVAMVLKTGMTCIMAGGRNFHYQPAPEIEDDFPA